MLTDFASTGVVRAPVSTTAMQVASRLLLVWGIAYQYPFVTQAPFYASMLVAWSVTEVIRYSYFATTLAGIQPKLLTLLRYNTFFVLYPLGIFSECSLIFITSNYMAGMDKFVLYAILVIYVPGKINPKRNSKKISNPPPLHSTTIREKF